MKQHIFFVLVLVFQGLSKELHRAKSLLTFFFSGNVWHVTVTVITVSSCDPLGSVFHRVSHHSTGFTGSALLEWQSAGVCTQIRVWSAQPRWALPLQVSPSPSSIHLHWSPPYCSPLIAPWPVYLWSLSLTARVWELQLYDTVRFSVGSVSLSVIFLDLTHV